MCAILLAGDVNAKPSEHNRDPAIATFRYENSRNNGPTNKPEKFIITSYVLIIMAAPSVSTSSSCSKSPNSKPNDGSIARVANYLCTCSVENYPVNKWRIDSGESGGGGGLHNKRE